MLAQWDDLASSKAYLTGGVGSRHAGEAIGDPYELPPDRAYCETCAAIASIMWNWRLLLVTGEARFADLLERTLYNGFLAGTVARRQVVLLHQPAAVARRARPGRLEPGRLLPAEHHAPARVARPVPRDDRPTTGVQLHQYATSTIRATSPGGRADRASRRDRLPVVRDGDDRGRREPGRGVDARAADPRLGARSIGRRRAGAPGAYAELTRQLGARRPVVARAGRLAAVDRAQSADRRGPRLPGRRARAARLLPRERRPAAARSTSQTSRSTRAGARRTRPVEALDGMQAVTVGGHVHHLDGWRSVEYLDLRDLSPAGQRGSPHRSRRSLLRLGEPRRRRNARLDPGSD